MLPGRFLFDVCPISPYIFSLNMFINIIYKIYGVYMGSGRGGGADQKKKKKKKKKKKCGFRTGPTQTKLYKHMIWLETGNYGFRK